MKALSILICTIPGREGFLSTLMGVLEKQSEGKPVEILIDGDAGSIGEKRNRLLNKASGIFCSFVDDDDMVSENYVDRILPAVENGCDCCELRGMYYENGKEVKPFIHSNVHNAYREDTSAYYRYPNHLNPMKTEIARQIGFPGINFGEDTDFATRLKRSGLIKSEWACNEILYFYLYRTQK